MQARRAHAHSQRLDAYDGQRDGSIVHAPKRERIAVRRFYASEQLAENAMIGVIQFVRERKLQLQRAILRRKRNRALELQRQLMERTHGNAVITSKVGLDAAAVVRCAGNERLLNFCNSRFLRGVPWGNVRLRVCNSRFLHVCIEKDLLWLLTRWGCCATRAESFPPLRAGHDCSLQEH